MRELICLISETKYANFETKYADLIFFFKGMTSVEMRKRRETDIAQLRKQKRDDEINKRRNIKENNDMFIGDEDDSMVLLLLIYCIKVIFA